MLDKFSSDLLGKDAVLLDVYSSTNPHYPEYNKELDFSASVEFFLDQIRAKTC